MRRHQERQAKTNGDNPVGQGDVIEIRRQRNLVLADYGIMNGRSPIDFDDVVLLAARSCDAEMATISIVQDSEEFFVSTHRAEGLPDGCDLLFCGHVVETRQSLLVEDAELDAHFSTSPLVTHKPHVRFYFGVPLISPEGIAVGALAVMDTRPRSISAEQKTALTELAAQVMTELELARSRCTLEIQRLPAGNQVDFERLFAALPIAAWAVEPEQFRVVAVTEETLALVGRRRADVIGNSVFDMLPQNTDDAAGHEGPQALLASLQRVKESGEVDVLPMQRYALPQPGPGGQRFSERFWHAMNQPVFDAAGHLAYIVHHTQDITSLVASQNTSSNQGDENRKLDWQLERMELNVMQRSAELKRINEHLQLAQQVANIGSWELHVPDFKRRWSPEIYRILGITPESAGRNFSVLDFVHPEDRERVLVARSEALQGKDISEVEHRVIRPDGDVRHVVQRGKVVTDARGRPNILYGTMQDVSEQRRIEKEMDARARQQAAVANLGQLALEACKLDHLFDVAVHCIADTLEVEYCKVLKLLPEEQVMKLVAGVGWQEGLVGNAVADIGRNSQAGYTLQSDAPVIVEDLRHDPRFTGPPLLQDHGVISGLSVIIHGQHGPWGVLGTHSTGKRRFGSDDVNFVQSVANIIAEAIRRRRSERELEARARQQAAVAKLGQQALQQVDLRALKQEAASTITETLGVEYCKILKRLPDDAGMKMVAGAGWKTGVVGNAILRIDQDSHAGYTLRNNGPVIIDDIRNETRFSPSPLLLEHGVVSGISVVISGDHGPWGVLGAHSSRRRNFTEDDVNFCQSIANVIAEATHRKSAEEAVRQSEALRQIAGRMAQLGAWRHIIGEPYVIWSDELCDIYDVPRGARPSLKEAINFIAPEHRERMREVTRRSMEEGRAFDEEAEVVTANERRVWVRIIGESVLDEYGNVLEIQGALQDITESKFAEAEIRSLATRLTTTLESITDAFFTLDRDWKFTYVNRMAETILQRSRDELLGRDVWSEFDVAKNHHFHVEYHRAVETQETVTFEEYYAPLDAWLSVTAYPSPDGLAVYFRDVTKRKRDEAKLIESEERFRAVAKATADTIWDWNLQTDGVWWNEGMCTVFGYDPADIEPDSRSFLLRIHPTDKVQVVAMVQDAITQGHDEWTAQYRFKRADDSYADVEVRGYVIRDGNGDAIRMVGGMNDISAAKDRENRLARQAALLDKAHDAIIVRDMQSRVTYWNRSAERIYGWTAEEAVGQRIDALLHNDAAVFDEAMQSLIENGEWTGELRKLRKDGTVVVSDVSWSLLVDESGKPEAIMGIDTDVTHRVALEEQLRQSQRLESVGQLTGGVAHDFNNLLTVILGNAELLTEQLPQGERMHKLADMTRKAALRGAELTHRLLAFARRQALEPRVVGVNDLVENMNNMLRRTLLENIDIEVIESADVWQAFADPGQLEAALLNLSLNAKDAMPGGGRLTIETANVELDEDYAAQNSEVAPGRYVMIAVSDTGCGIDPENLERVFDPFFTTKEKGKGTGLGLSMAYGFAKQSRGHIKIYSEPGQGTTVKLYLPRATRPGESPAAVRGDDTDLTGHEKVLVVEDNELVRAHAENQLSEYGYEVLTASNGPEAIEVIRNNDDIDLLFTDVIMSGGMNGRDLAEMASRIRPRLKILYTSGYTENAIVHHGRLDRGVHLLQKPYQRRDLAKKVRVVLNDTAGAQPEDRS